MTDAEETGDPEPIEFGTVWILGAQGRLSNRAGLVCWCLGQCVGDTDRSGRVLIRAAGCRGASSRASARCRSVCCCLQQGATGAADAVAIATDELVDDKPRRPGGAYDECCGCGDCWGTPRAGFAAAGRRKRRRRGRGMPPPVAPIAESDDKPTAPFFADRRGGRPVRAVRTRERRRRVFELAVRPALGGARQRSKAFITLL